MTKSEKILRQQVKNLREELETERRKSSLLLSHVRLCLTKHTYFGPRCSCFGCTGSVPNFIP